MGDAGIHYLAFFLRMTRSVKELKFNNCQITNAGLEILCKSMLNFHVDLLHLKGNLITSKSLMILKRCVEFKIKTREIMEAQGRFDEDSSPGIGFKFVNIKDNQVEKDETAIQLIREFGQMGVTIII